MEAIREVVRLSLETQGLDGQLEQLSTLLESVPEGLRQHAFDLVSGYIDRLSADVVVGKNVAATGTDGSCHLTCRLLLGSDFENLLAALRAGKFDSGV